MEQRLRQDGLKVWFDEWEINPGDSIFTKGPADVLDHATSGIAIGSKPGIDTTKKLPGESFKRPWPPLHQDG